MIAVDDENFETVVVHGNRPVLVMFYAPWAGPCNLVREAFTAAEERADTVNFAIFNLDDNPDTPARYGVRAVPLFVLFDGASVRKMKVGAIPVEGILEMLEGLPEAVVA